MLKRALSATGFALLTSAMAGQAAVFSVDRTDDDATASACTEAPLDCSLRGALETANLSAGPDEIVVPAGTFTLSQNTGSADALPVGSEVVIRGSGIDQTFLIAGAGFPGSAVVVNAGGTLTLEDLTLSGFEPNPAQSPAGALHVTGAIGASALLRRVRIENSRGQSGGGILVSRSDGGLEPDFRLQLFDSIISGNAATADPDGQACEGGGLALLNGRVAIERSAITGNSTEIPASGGGGICADSVAELVIDGSTIDENMAGLSGAGIRSEGTNLLISSSFIQDNRVSITLFGQGGALFLRAGSAVIVDSVLQENINPSEGATAIYCEDSVSLQLRRSTVQDTLNDRFALRFFSCVVEISDTTFSGRGGRLFASESTLDFQRVEMFPTFGDDSALRLIDSTLVGSDLSVDGFRTAGVRRGGAIQADGSTITIDGCELRFLRAESDMDPGESGLGGAVYATNSTLTMNGCTIANAQAELLGGAFALVAESMLTLTNSTVSDNSAANGEALYMFGDSQATLQNVTIANPNGANQVEIFQASATIDNSAIEGTCLLFSSGGNAESLGNLVTDSSCQVQNAGDLVVPDLLIHPLTDNGGGSPSHLPRVNSPLIDFAMNCPDEDQRGELRGEPCDAGAIERVIADNNLFMDSFEE